MQGVMMYGAINIAAFALTILLTLLWIVLGLFCWSLRCCGWKPKEKSYFLPKKREITMNVCLSLFIVVLFILIIMGYVIGSAKIFDCISEAPDAASGPANIYYDEMTPLETLLIGSIGSVLVPFISSVNSTVIGAVNLYKINVDIQQVNSSFYEFPSFQAVASILDSVSDIATEAEIYVEDIITDLVNISDVSDLVTDKAEAILDDLNDVSKSVSNITSTLTETSTLVNNITAINTKLFNDPTNDGLVYSVISDLGTIQRSYVIGAGFPTASNFSNAATGSSESMSRMLAGDYNNNNLAELKLFVAHLQTMYESIAVLPDYNETASDITTINNTIKELVGSNGIADQLIANLKTLNTKLNYVPTASEINSDVDGLYSATNHLSLTSISNHINDIADLVNEIPGLIDTMLGYVQILPRVIKSLSPVLYDLLVARTEGFNKYVMKLPINSTKMFRSLNKTLYSSLEVVTTITESLESSRSSVDNVNVTYYKTLVNSASSSYNSEIASFNFSGIKSEVNSMFNKLSAINFTTYITSIEDLQTTFSGLYIPASTVTLLVQLQVARGTLEKKLQRVVSSNGYTGSTWNTAATRTGDYLLLEQGVCSADTTTYCSSNSGCTSGTCTNIGVYRCSSNGVSSQSVLACTSDATCSALGGGSYCLMDSNAATAVQTQLTIFSANVLPSMTSVTSKLTSLASNEYDTTSVSDQITSTSNALSIVDVSDYIDAINSTLDGLTAFSLTDINSTLQSVKSSLNGVNYSSFNDTLSTLKSKRGTVLDSVSKYLTFIDGLTEYIYEPSELKAGLTALSYDTLLTESADKTPGGMSRYIAGQFENMYSTFRDICEPLSSDFSTPPKKNITSTFETPNLVFDRGSDHSTLANHGSLYYLMSQASTTRKKMILADDTTADTVTTDKDGNSYPDDKYCLTRSCFQNTQTSMSTDTSTVPLAPKTIVSIIWAPLALVFLVALWSALCPLCTKDPCRRCGPSTCLLILIIIEVPWYFLGSAFLLPMSIVVSDGCYSGTNIANNYVTAYGDSLCTSTFSGEGTLEACVVKSNNFTTTVNIQSMVDGLLGTCASVDPFNSVIVDLATQAKSVINSKSTKYVNGSSFETIRTPVRDIIVDAGTNAGDVLYTFLTETGEVIDCPGMSAIVSGFKQPVCETFVGSLGWLAAMLYLAAWTMCCLGIPAACMISHHNKWEMIEAKTKVAAGEVKAEGEEGEAPEGEGDDDKNNHSHVYVRMSDAEGPSHHSLDARVYPDDNLHDPHDRDDAGDAMLHREIEMNDAVLVPHTGPNEHYAGAYELAETNDTREEHAL
jgi:hypothetical protein